MSIGVPPAGKGAELGGGAEVVPLRTRQSPRVIAVTSGKGGVGKSVISANLAVALARSGRKVLVVDADLALANLDLILGVNARASVREVLSNEVPIEQAIIEGPAGVALLPACSGDVNMAELGGQHRMALFSAIDTLQQRYDTLIVDTGAGVGSNAIDFAAAAQQVLVVVTPDPTSMADAYAVIKVLSRRRGVNRIHLVVNQASGPREADGVVERLASLVARFLDVSLIPVGFIYSDEAVSKSVRACQPVLIGLPSAPVSASLRALAARLIEEVPGDPSGGPALFWQRLMGLKGRE